MGVDAGAADQVGGPGHLPVAKDATLHTRSATPPLCRPLLRCAWLGGHASRNTGLPRRGLHVRVVPNTVALVCPPNTPPSPNSHPLCAAAKAPGRA